MSIIPIKIHSQNQKVRGHLGLNLGPLDLQSNALPLSYTPLHVNMSKIYDRDLNIQLIYNN